MNRHPSAFFMVASRTSRRATGLSIITALLLGACGTPRDSEMFHIVNDTSSTVTVGWKANDGHPFATLAPDEATSRGLHSRRCSQPKADEVLVAKAANGKAYTYGPRICSGTIWRIGS